MNPEEMKIPTEEQPIVDEVKEAAENVAEAAAEKLPM